MTVIREIDHGLYSSKFIYWPHLLFVCSLVFCASNREICLPGFQAVQPTGQMRQARPTGAQQGMRAAMNARPITGQQPNGAPGTRMGVPGAGMPRGAGGTMQGMPPGAQPRASFKFTPAMRNPPPQQVPQQQSIQQVMIAHCLVVCVTLTCSPLKLHQSLCIYIS